MLKKEKPQRSRTGIAAKTNSTNKKYLAKDFINRCAYCDDIDTLGGGYRSYQVDHFAPKTKFEDLEYVYDNLLYTCPWCNRAKWDKWPSNNSETSIVGNSGFVDPCTDEYYIHLNRDPDGSIRWITLLGKYMYNELQLYLKRHMIIYNLDRLKESRNKLKQSILNDEVSGRDVSKKSLLLKSIDDEFFHYYNKWEEISHFAT